MKKYFKDYLLRGLIFSGFGPLIAGLVYLILDIRGVNIDLSGVQIFIAILSTYVIAFVHAGSSIFPQIDRLPKVGAMFIQLGSLYLVYVFGYLINGWIPFNYLVLIIFTSVFVGGFLLIWLIVYLTTKNLTKNLNRKLEEIR